MVEIASSLETAIDSLKDMVSGPIQGAPRSEALEIGARAIRAIEMDEGFSVDDLVDAALVIQGNHLIAKVYLSTKNKKERTSFLLHHMEKLKRGD